MMQPAKIESMGQYLEYCKRHEEITFSGRPEAETEQETGALWERINEYDNRHGDEQPPLSGADVLLVLMNMNRLTNKDVADKLGLTPSLVSDILSGKEGFTEEIIRKLACTFKVFPDAFQATKENNRGAGLG